jgi:hypothetical protein
MTVRRSISTSSATEVQEYYACRSIGLANRFELVYLDKPGVTIYGWGASVVRMPAHGPLPGLDAVS